MRFTVSVKGILRERGRVLFLRNERDELELPGGQLELGESVEEALVREIREETGIVAEPDALVHAGVFEVVPGQHVLVIVYRCHHQSGTLSLSDEHVGHEWLQDAEMKRPDMPEFYRTAIVGGG